MSTHALASRLKFRLDAMVEGDGSEQAAIEGSGMSISYRFTAELYRALMSADVVPGVWKCPKCKFTLTQRSLNANTGAVSVRDTPGEKCPNCDTPLWRHTWRDEAGELATLLEAELARRAANPSVFDELVDALEAQVASTRLFGKRLGLTDDEITTSQAERALALAKGATP